MVFLQEFPLKPPGVHSGDTAVLPSRNPAIVYSVNPPRFFPKNKTSGAPSENSFGVPTDNPHSMSSRGYPPKYLPGVPFVNTEISMLKCSRSSFGESCRCSFQDAPRSSFWESSKSSPSSSSFRKILILKNRQEFFRKFFRSSS